MVNRRLITQLESQGLLDNRQFAFRPEKGADDYLTELEDLIDGYLERGMHGDCVSLDLSKAYDRAWCFPILKSLEEWGIKGRMGRYIESFLDDRSFRVIIGNHRSQSRSQENGIPQGSVIAPTLFLICMQSIFDSIPPNVHILVYADDITIITFHNVKSIARKRIQTAVNTISEWADERGFTISPEKSQLLHISYNRKKMSKLKDLTLNNTIIKSGPTLKILGVYLDRTLSFRQHADKVREAIDKRLRVIKMIGSRMPSGHRSSIMRVVDGWLLPKVFYGAGIFSRGSDTVNKRLRPMYNKAFRMASGVFITSPISAIMAECGQLPYEHFLTICVVTKAARWLSLNGRVDVPLVTRAKNLLNSLSIPDLPPIASLSRKRRRPWHQPPPKIDLSLLHHLRAGDPPTKVQQHFLTLRSDKYNNYHHIYTDGSVCGDKVGYGITSDSNSISSSLPPSCSIFSAEAYALMVASSLNPPQSHKPAVVFTDSASCLSAMDSNSQKHPWLMSAELSSLANNVSFCWIPGHCGILGNEEADRLAGVGRDMPIETVAVPSADAVRWAKNKVRESWELEWFNSRHVALRRIKESTFRWPDIKNPKDRRTLSRLRIGHTRLTHSYLITKEDRPDCITCGVPLSIPHILTDCRAYHAERLNYNIDIALEEVLSPSSEQQLLKFLKATGLYEQI